MLEKVLNNMGVYVCVCGEGGGLKTHSFRIGAATSAYEAGCSSGTIMKSGRWKSKV